MSQCILIHLFNLVFIYLGLAASTFFRQHQLHLLIQYVFIVEVLDCPWSEHVLGPCMETGQCILVCELWQMGNHYFVVKDRLFFVDLLEEAVIVLKLLAESDVLEVELRDLAIGVVLIVLAKIIIDLLGYFYVAITVTGLYQHFKHVDLYISFEHIKYLTPT